MCSNVTYVKDRTISDDNVLGSDLLMCEFRSQKTMSRKVLFELQNSSSSAKAAAERLSLCPQTEQQQPFEEPLEAPGALASLSVGFKWIENTNPMMKSYFQSGLYTVIGFYPVN
ncbi:hypothetical protein CB1_001437047 [Camelus ferus]|nr:hypothetical protein CB1_001437047 [Camelus ferus]